MLIAPAVAWRVRRSVRPSVSDVHTSILPLVLRMTLVQGIAAADTLTTLAAHLTEEDARVLFDPLNRPK